MDVIAYFDIIRNPRDNMSKALKKVDVMDGAKSFALAGALWGLLAGLFFAFLGTLFGALVGTESGPLGAVLAGLGAVSIVVLPVVAAIIAVLGAVIGYGIMNIAAGFLGGKGTFEQTFYLGSRLVWPLLIAGIIVNLLTLIPILGWLIQVAWGLYTLYLLTTLIAVVHKLSMWKSLGAIVLPWIVLTFLFAFTIAAIV